MFYFCYMFSVTDVSQSDTEDLIDPRTGLRVSLHKVLNILSFHYLTTVYYICCFLVTIRFHISYWI